MHRFLVIAAFCATGQLGAQQYILSTLAGRTVVPPASYAPQVAIPTPSGLVYDSTRSKLYFSGANAVYVVDSPGGIARVAGTGFPGFSGDNGPAFGAQLNAPRGLAVDGSGNLYIADSKNYRIRKVTPSGVMSTVAGTGVSGTPTLPATAVSVPLILPTGVIVDSSGANLYVADATELLKISLSTNTMTRFAVTPPVDVSGGPALALASTMAFDASGNLYLPDPAGHRVLKIPPSGSAAVFAGNGTAGTAGDGGLATSAQLDTPQGVAIDSSGKVYIGDSGNPVRVVGSDGKISVDESGVNSNGSIFIDPSGYLYVWSFALLVRATPGRFLSGMQLAGTGQFGEPRSIAAGLQDSFYYSAGNAVQKVDREGVRSAFAGAYTGFSGDGGLAINASLNQPRGLASDSAGNVYIADSGNDRVRKVGTDGVIQTIAGNGASTVSGDGGPAPSAGLGIVEGVAIDSSGNIYIAAESRIRKVTPTGTISTYAGGGSADPGDGGSAVNTSLGAPFAPVLDASGNLYFADTLRHRVRKVTPGGTISTVAGTGVAGFSGDGGTAVSAKLNAPAGLAFDSAGGLLICDSANSVVRRVDSSGNIATIGGIGNQFGDAPEGGIATANPLWTPWAMTTGASGRIFFTERGASLIRALTTTGTLPVLSATVSPVGVFTIGQSNASYTITVRNAAQAGPTSGTVSVSAQQQTFSRYSILGVSGGLGWACINLTCARNDILPAGSSYPPITVSMDLGPGVASQIAAQTQLSGGGATASAITSVFAVNPITTSPAAPVLISPLNGATGVPSRLSLQWAPSEGAVSYDVYFGFNANPPLIINTSSTAVSTGTLSAGTYYWRIVARNPIGTATSPAFSFTTVNPCTTAAFAPEAPFIDNAAQPVNLTLTVAPAGCDWTMSSDSAWALTTYSGTGSGPITVFATANTSNTQRTATLTIAGQSVTLTQRRTATLFGDVSATDFYFDAVNLMRNKSITAGCSTTPLLYCPAANVTRGQMAVFLVRAIAGGDTFTNTATPYFGDVPATHTYFKWIQKLRDLGVTAGCGNGNYCPDDSVTRGQMAVFIIRARMGSATVFTSATTPYFTDVTAAHPFFTWIQKMRQVGVTAGCSATAYCPNDPVTRGQMAIFLERGAFNELLAAGTPLVSVVSPGAGSRGTVVTVTIAGSNTNFVQGATQVLVGGAGVSVGAVTVTSATSLTAQVTVAAVADSGARSFVVTTGAEEAVGPNLFVVQ